MMVARLDDEIDRKDCRWKAPVPWLAPTATSTNTLLAQVTGTVPRKDVVRYRVRRGKGRGTTDTRRQGVSRDRSSEPVAEDIGATQKHPPVHRESVRTRAVVRGTLGGGGEKVKDRRTTGSRLSGTG